MNATKWAVWVLFLCVPCMGQKYVDIRVRPERQTWEFEPMAATPNYWQGGGDPTVAAAWSLGHTPTAGEAAVADGRSQDAFMVNVTGAGTGPDEFVTTPDFLGDVGSPGAHYNIFTTNTVKITLRGQGNAYVSPVVDTCAVIVDKPQGEVVIGDVLTTLLMKDGIVTLLPACNIKTHLALYSDSCRLTIEGGGGTDVPDWSVMHGGRVSCKRATGNSAAFIGVYAGEWIQTGLVHTEATVITEGIFRYAPSADPSGESPKWFIDGLFDVRESSFTIPVGFAVWGPNAEVLGSIAETPTWMDFDLRQDYP